MDDAKINEILNSLAGATKAPLPKGFENKVLDRWQAHIPAQKSNRWVYWAAASLIAFTLLNGWAFYELSATQDDLVESTNIETQFSDEYKLVKTSDYYTFNETTK